MVGMGDLGLVKYILSKFIDPATLTSGTYGEMIILLQICRFTLIYQNQPE